MGVTTQGNTGGLVIPSAGVLPTGSAALTIGNYQEPKLGVFSRRQNYSFGVGLIPYVELFGRYAEYQNPAPGSDFVSGPRDISANVKVQMPPFWKSLPKLAAGLNDVSGGAVYFRSAYVVASERWGPVNWSLGYAKGSAIHATPGNLRNFDGPFGGLEWEVGQTGLSVLGEHDGEQPHVGLRYRSAPLRMLGDSTLTATLQRSVGNEKFSAMGDRTTFALSLAMPLDFAATRASHFQPARAMPPAGWAQSGAVVLSPQDRQEAIQKTLAGMGFGRVRAGALGDSLVVEYENSLFAQNESDAIGIVLGVAAEYAEESVRRVSAVTLKSGVRVYETSVGAKEFREYLRHGDGNYVRTSLAVDIGVGHSDLVRWASAPSPARRARVEIGPEIDYSLATEVSQFDYSLAANVKAYVPLWRGGEVLLSHVEPIAESENVEPGGVYRSLKHRRGMRTASINQTAWLGRSFYGIAGVGLFDYSRLGAQAHGVLFVPGRDDQVHVKAGVYERKAGMAKRRAFEGAATYRFQANERTVVEGGVQQYTDGSAGPSLMLTRWFGDVGVHLFYRKGGDRQFAGLELSVPLTPRRGGELAGVSFTGNPRFTRGVRTRLTDDNTGINLVSPTAVREMRMEYNLDSGHLNSGRISQSHFISQLPRMREAFYEYARDKLPL